MHRASVYYCQGTTMLIEMGEIRSNRKPSEAPSHILHHEDVITWDFKPDSIDLHSTSLSSFFLPLSVSFPSNRSSLNVWWENTSKLNWAGRVRQVNWGHWNTSLCVIPSNIYIFNNLLFFVGLISYSYISYAILEIQDRSFASFVALYSHHKYRIVTVNDFYHQANKNIQRILR